MRLTTESPSKTGDSRFESWLARLSLSAVFGLCREMAGVVHDGHDDLPASEVREVVAHA
jgi:hypothetical protein